MRCENGLNRALVSASGGALHRRRRRRRILHKDILRAARHSISTVIDAHNLEGSPDNLVTQVIKKFRHTPSAFRLEHQLLQLVIRISARNPRHSVSIRRQASVRVGHFRIDINLQLGRAAISSRLKARGQFDVKTALPRT